MQFYEQLLEFWRSFIGDIPKVNLDSVEWTSNINSALQILPETLTVATILLAVILFFGGVIFFFKIIFSILKN